MHLLKSFTNPRADIIGIRTVILAMAIDKMTTEQWMELKKDLQNIFENYLTRLDEIRKRNDHVVAAKQELENMSGSDSEIQNYDFILEETKDLADEVGVDAQAPVDTEPKSWSEQEQKTKEQVSVKDSTNFEEDEKLQDVLDSDNFDSPE